MIKRKKKILIGALELLEEGGINNVTTKKMAAQQGVSEPALYRQYKSKQEIVKGIIEEYATYDQQIMSTIRESDMLGKKGVDFYVKRFAELYRNYSEITTVMFSMDLYFYNEDTKEMMKDIMNRRHQFLAEIIAIGQSRGDIDIIYSADELAEIINGLIAHKVLQWRMNDKSGNIDESLVSMVQRLL